MMRLSHGCSPEKRPFLVWHVRVRVSLLSENSTSRTINNLVRYVRIVSTDSPFEPYRRLADDSRTSIFSLGAPPLAIVPSLSIDPFKFSKISNSRWNLMYV